MIQRYPYYKLLILLFIIISQLFAPRIQILGVPMSLDFFLIYLTYISTHNNRLFLIFLGFSLGLIQDIITQYELLGLFAFTKTIVGFILGTLDKYRKIWKKNIKMLFLFLVYLFHFILSSYLMFERSTTPIFYILEISLIQSIWTFAILYIINRFLLIDNKIIE